jgi:hypothetical protein
MAYTIYNTDGSVLVTLGEGKSDQVSTSLTLIGKNYPNYGEIFNNNLIKLLGNFSSVNEPSSPITGQIWYDSAEGRIKVYDLNGVFRPITNALSASVLPVEIANNDFWFDTHNQQLFFTPDANNLYLIGPTDSIQLGKNGWISKTVPDSTGNIRTITELYSSGTQLGILSTSSFTLGIPLSGMTVLQAGLNLNQTVSGIRFIGTATSADTVQGIDISQLVKNTGVLFQTINGSITVKDNNGLIVSNNLLQSISLRVNPTTQVGTLIYNTADKNLSIEVTNSVVGSTSSIYVNSLNQYLGLWNTSPNYPVDINGNVFIRGDLIVNGSQTVITSTTLRIYDPNIEIGYPVGIADDILADGGGITLYGTTNKTITWVNDNTGWNFNTNTNVTADSTYMIGGVSVITANSLGLSITTAPALTNVGVLSELTVTNVYITGNTISAIGTNQTLYLSGSGSGTIDATGDRITNVHYPADPTDAATKQYADDTLFKAASINYAFTLDWTGNQTNNFVEYWSNQMFPIKNPGYPQYDIPNGARLKVLCASYTYSVTIPSLQGQVAVTQTTPVYTWPSQTTATISSILPGNIATYGTSTVATPVVSYSIKTLNVISISTSTSTWQVV